MKISTIIKWVAYLALAIWFSTFTGVVAGFVLAGAVVLGIGVGTEIAAHDRKVWEAEEKLADQILQEGEETWRQKPRSR